MEYIFLNRVERGVKNVFWNGTNFTMHYYELCIQYCKSNKTEKKKTSKRFNFTWCTTVNMYICVPV